MSESLRQPLPQTLERPSNELDAESAQIISTLLDEAEAGSSDVARQRVLLDIATKIHTSESHPKSRTIPGMDEWIPGPVKTTYFQVFTDKDGKSFAYQYPEKLGERLLKFRTDFEAAANKVTDGSITATDPGKATSPADTQDTVSFNAVSPGQTTEPTDLSAERKRRRAAHRPQGSPSSSSASTGTSAKATAPKPHKASESSPEPTLDLSPEQQAALDGLSPDKKAKAVAALQKLAKIGDVASFKLINYTDKNGKHTSTRVYAERDDVHTTGAKKGQHKLKLVSHEDILAAYGKAGQTQGTREQFEAREARNAKAKAKKAITPTPAGTTTGQTAPADSQDALEQAEANSYGLPLAEYRAIMDDDSLSTVEKQQKLMVVANAAADAARVLIAPAIVAPRNNYAESGMTDTEYEALKGNPNLTEQQKTARMGEKRAWAKTIMMELGMTPAEYVQLRDNPNLTPEQKAAEFQAKADWAKQIMRELGLTGAEYSAIRDNPNLTPEQKAAEFQLRQARANQIFAEFGLTAAGYAHIAYNPNLTPEQKAERFEELRARRARFVADEARRNSGFRGVLRRIFTTQGENGERTTRKAAVAATVLGTVAVAALATDKFMEAKYGAGFLPWSTGSGIGDQAVRGAVEGAGGGGTPDLPSPELFVQPPAAPPVAGPELHLTNQGDTIWGQVTDYLRDNGYPTDDVTVDTVKDAVLNSNGLTEAGAENLDPGYTFNIPPEVLAGIQKVA